MMLQDRKSGSVARDWGLKTARRIADYMGAIILEEYSNECDYEGERIVIKCASHTTECVGVTKNMLGRVQKVYGAFQGQDNIFRIWRISSERYDKLARWKHGPKPVNTEDGECGMVRKKSFEIEGEHVCTIDLNSQS